MTPKVKISETVFPDSSKRHRGTFHDQIWWKSAVAKLQKGCVVYYQTKKLALRGTRPSAILPQMGWSCPKFPERYHPLTCPRRLYIEFGPDWLRSAGLIPERLIFRPNKSMQSSSLQLCAEGDLMSVLKLTTDRHSHAASMRQLCFLLSDMCKITYWCISTCDCECVCVCVFSMWHCDTVPLWFWWMQVSV